ncbi:MAG: hypothetical protein Kow00107_00310 [Planctomycetota bacterium]
MKKALLLFAIFVLAGGFALANPSYVGKEAPSFGVGKAVQEYVPATELRQLYGDVVLVEFFATWCGPCRAGMPHINSLYEKYNRPDFHILASTRETENIVSRFLYHHELGTKLKYPILVNSNANWGVTGIPQVYIVGRDGKVVWEGSPSDARNMELAIEKALAAADPSAPELDKKTLPVLDAYARSDFGAVLKAADKLRAKDQESAVADYLEGLVEKANKRMLSKVEYYKEMGDMYMAQQCLEEMLKPFKGTKYEDGIKDTIKLFKDDKELKQAVSIWEDFHKILAEARTGKKSSIEDALKKLEALRKKHAETPIVPEIERMIEVLKKPWDAAEAHG